MEYIEHTFKVFIRAELLEELKEKGFAEQLTDFCKENNCEFVFCFNYLIYGAKQHFHCLLIKL